MNLVLITSCIHPYSGISFYSSNERMDQLVNKTIFSIKEKIPNSYIVILEGSKVSSTEIEILNNNSDELVLYDVYGLEKSMGELFLILNFINSDQFLKIYNMVDSLIKISGRYYLLENYNFDMYKGCVIKINKKEWSNEFASETRYYKITKNKIKNFIENLNKLYSNGIYRDLEHSFYKYNIISPNDQIKKLEIGGFCGVDGSYVED